MIPRLSIAFAVLVAIALAAPASITAAPCWEPPVTGTVVDPFRAPPCPYCAGNRGVEYRVAAPVVVRAVASGIVSWAGVVAGTRYVVVRHADGWRATYGELSTTELATGDVVRARSRVGSVRERFHFGLRIGDRYVDPTPFFGELVGRHRLIPSDGRRARPAPPPRLRCAGDPGGTDASGAVRSSAARIEARFVR